jgi:hypothetical protein
MMRRVLMAAMGLLLVAGVAQGGGSRPGGGTGDTQLDGVLGSLGSEAKANPGGLVELLSSRYGVPEREIRRARDTYGLGAGDLFMATALAKASGRPVVSIAGEYRKNQGKGWGVMAKSLGIKPGSREFRELKAGAQGSLDHMHALARSNRGHEQELKQEHDRKAKKDAQGKSRGKSR